MTNQDEFEFGFPAIPVGPPPGLSHRKEHPDNSAPASRSGSSPRPGGQGQLGLAVDGTEKGYTEWLAGRRIATQALARRLGLPLGHQVEVWLVGGIRLRGKLRLEEEVLVIEEENVRHLALRVDTLTFAYREMESCVRLD